MFNRQTSWVGVKRRQLKVPSHPTNLCYPHGPCRHWSLQPLNYCILYTSDSQQRGIEEYQNCQVAFSKYTPSTWTILGRLSFWRLHLIVLIEACLGDSDTIIWW